VKIVADCNIPFVKECFSSIGEVVAVPGRQIEPKILTDVDILLVRSITKVDSKLLAGSKIRFVGTATIGFEHVDLGYLANKGIAFASAPGSNANSVAEYVVAALLSVARRYKIELEGKSIGIVGVGNVGSRVATKVKALGMEPYLNDPPLQRRTVEAKYLPIEALYDCDFITLHTPLTFEGLDKTFHLADERFFERLKPGSIFINTSRGPVVDTQALKKAIKSGKLAAVVLDVWENEPNIDIELLQMVDIATPHIAGYSLDGKVAGMIMIYRAVCEFLGLEPRYEPEDFLPEPRLPEINIEPDGRKEQDILHDTIQQVYPIDRDDLNTRQIVSAPVEQRGKMFDELRRNYPQRREFQNTKVLLPPDHFRLAEKFEGIGFVVSRLGEDDRDSG